MSTSIKTWQKQDCFWLLFGFISLSILYLNLTWKATADLDRITTDSLFWAAILWMLWQKRERLNYESSFISSFLGLFLLGIILTKTISLFWFESALLSLVPFCVAVSLALIASGFKGLHQYWRELFFSWFLFFPTGVIGHFLDRQIHITVWTAKVATYFLYYVGFNVANQGNFVLLSLPDRGEFKAIVDYPCAGVPIILLMLKLSLILLSLIPLKRSQQLFLPLISIGMGFTLGVIRVCILTLVIPEPAKFDYWHGSEGSQIFSTLGIIIFSVYCYWIMQQQESKDSSTLQMDGINE